MTISYTDRWGKLLPAEALPFQCGNCGERFATKGEKRRHKLSCPTSGQVRDFDHVEDEACDHADLYGRNHSTAEIRARAAAEWAAMDWRGRLPDGWEYKPQARLDAVLAELGEG